MRDTGRVLAACGLAWAMGITAWRTLRPPNDFAEAHWLLDYRFGFVRRGLAGSILREGSLLGFPLQTESAIRTVSYSVFALLCAALFVLAVRIVSRAGWNRHVVLIVGTILTSPFIVTNAHLMGYLDHVVYLLTFVSVWLTMKGRPWSGAVVVAVGMLVHESTLVIAVPLLALTVLAQHAAAPGSRHWRQALTPLGVPIAAFVAVAVAERLCGDRLALRHLLQLRLHRYPFVEGDMHLFVPEWLTTSLSENAASQAHRFLERLTDSTIVVSVLPALQATLFGAIAWMTPSTRRRVGTGLILVSGAPLLLHLSAWDTARLWTYTIGSAFGGLWIIMETVPGAVSGALVLTPVIAIPVLYQNLTGRIPLLDGVTERFTNPELLALYAPAALAYFVFCVLEDRGRGGSHE